MTGKIYRRQSSSNRSGKQSWRSKIWTSNVFSIFLLILLIASFVKVSQEVLLRYEINKEINNLERQLGDLQDKTEKMEQLISYLQTDEYIEKEARLKLNLSKPGEKQINLANPDEKSIVYQEEDNTTNVGKWFNYFFN
ncbi:septum formation initiator family protein [Patescibacteria group bacterium]|nr:septum formation initiator family protein [Patescibacteria group bacterium]